MLRKYIFPIPLTTKRHIPLLSAALLGTALLPPATGFCGRNIDTLPFTENFDTDNYQDLVWTDKGARHQWVEHGGWQGSGGAKFFPNTSPQGYSGLGQFTEINGGRGVEQLNVRFLIYHGKAWNRAATPNKVLIMNRADGFARPMILSNADERGGWKSYGACDNTVCKYEGGDYWPDGTDSFRLGDPPQNREEEWISVEYEANVRTGKANLYIYTQDGKLSGLYIEKDLEESALGEPLIHYIDILGGYFNNGTPANPDTYFIIDELKVDDSYIGPPAGFVNGPSPQAQYRYTVLDPGMNSSAITSLADNNVITAGNSTLNLDLYEHGAFYPNTGAISQGVVITGTGPFEMGSGKNVTDVPAHASLAGRQFVMPHVRYTHYYHMVSPNGDAAVQLEVDGTPHQINLPQGVVVDFDAGNTNGNLSSAVITSDTPILVSHRAFKWGSDYIDASPVPPAATELWGFRSTYAFVAATEDDTHVRLYASDGTSAGMTLQAGERRFVYIGKEPAESAQGTGSAIRLVSDKPIGAVQLDDGDGQDQTAFFATSQLNERFGIPKNTQYIAVACADDNTSVTLYNGNSAPVTRICNAQGNYPGKAYFGTSANGTAPIGEDAYLESNKPIYVIYEVADSQDEHNLIGAKSIGAEPASGDQFDVGPVFHEKPAPGDQFDVGPVM